MKYDYRFDALDAISQGVVNGVRLFGKFCLWVLAALVLLALVGLLFPEAEADHRSGGTSRNWYFQLPDTYFLYPTTQVRHPSVTNPTRADPYSGYIGMDGFPMVSIDPLIKYNRENGGDYIRDGKHGGDSPDIGLRLGIHRWFYPNW